jgi:enterochelin esterase-like enzyme
MRDLLQAQGAAVRYREFGAGHTFLCWQGTLADGIVALTDAGRPI